MITVIQATNRPDSNTEFVSRHIAQLLENIYDGEVHYVSMGDLPPEILMADIYDKALLPEKLKRIQDEAIIPADKFVWILPEYNGSFPGILKLFIDALSVRKRKETFKSKKSMLVGIATGRSGNIRGMDHLIGILLHLQAIVFPRLLPISSINDLMDAQGRINHGPTLTTLESHLKEFIDF
jgi:NAD(P)H-dependent FMN reductase